MRLLVDTHCWLSSHFAPERLGERARALLADGDQELILSAASAWEIAIKIGLGKLRLPEPPARFVTTRMQSHGVRALPISHEHALRVVDLPAHHRDPFDRLLIAQAQVEDLSILTADDAFRRYDVDVTWARDEGA